MDEHEKKRIRILNRMLVIIIILSLFFLIVDFTNQVYEGVAITFTVIFTNFIILILIRNKKHTLAKWLSLVFIIMYISTLTILTGKNTGTIIYFIPGALFPTVIFYNKKLVLTLSTLIISLFCVLFWVIQSIDPYIVLTDEIKVTYQFSGTMGVIIASFLMMWYFKNLNANYENIIITKNENLVHSNNKIKQQKLKLEIKNKEITDSINYASRIQQAILPSDLKLNKYLKNKFILYLPKDIVAGDFYWMENVNDCIFFAAADCTGHGVPGALVSVICSSALSKVVVEEMKENPAEVLNRTRDLVIERFGRTDKQINDGMDISLCAFNPLTGNLNWAGANNALWIVRKDGKEIEIIKADKQPIGRYVTHEPFTSHNTKLNEGDTIYLFTDGFADQFGGIKGKKYKTAKFKLFLLSIQDHDMNTQLNLIKEEFNQWKGNFEQIDDVCIMGVKA